MKYHGFPPACTWWCVWCCVSEYTCMFVCYMCMVYGCVHVHQCVLLCQHLQNGGYKTTRILTCIFNHTSTNNTHTVLAIAHFSCYMLQLIQCDVTVCTFYIELRNKKVLHTSHSIHVLFSTISIYL